jgi:hypothetical protein
MCSSSSGFDLAAMTAGTFTPWLLDARDATELATLRVGLMASSTIPFRSQAHSEVVLGGCRSGWPEGRVEGLDQRPKNFRHEPAPLTSQLTARAA